VADRGHGVDDGQEPAHGEDQDQHGDRDDRLACVPTAHRQQLLPTPAPVPVPVVRDPPSLADPADVARSLALCVAEILSGAREVDTVARWITDDVHRHLQHRAAVAARARSAARRPAGRPVIRIGSVVLGRPRAGVVEAAVVVHTRTHARAVAIRLETRGGRWRATAIGVL
jgi:hypothetical protein